MSEPAKTPVQVKVVDIDLPFGVLCKFVGVFLGAIAAVALALAGAAFMLVVLFDSFR